jgi:DNA-binding FadR family transcriptional regulator
MSPSRDPVGAIGASPLAEVRDRIVEHIRRSGRLPGERIETERALQSVLGVSRSRVRDALAALEAQGVVTRRIGSGTYLAEMASPAPALAGAVSLDRLSPSSLMEARITLEVAMLSLVVKNATNSDLKALKATLDAADAARTPAEFERRDTEFHHLLAESAHNPLLSRFAEMIIEARHGTEWGRAKERSSTPRNRQGYQHDHRRILQAVRNRDAEGAVAAMRRHLLTIQDTLLGR